MSLEQTSIRTAVALALLALPFAQANAADVSVGGGLRTSFSSTSFDTDFDEDGDDDSFSDFAVNSARLYISGKATENIGFMFNTEYNSNNETIRVIDAVAQFSFSDGKHNERDDQHAHGQEQPLLQLQPTGVLAHRCEEELHSRPRRFSVPVSAPKMNQ